MRKLTALTFALSLSAAGQAFAGEPHATHAAPPPHPQATSQASTSHAPTGQAHADTDLTADLVEASQASRNYKASSSVISATKDMMDTLLQTSR